MRGNHVTNNESQETKISSTNHATNFPWNQAQQQSSYWQGFHL